MVSDELLDQARDILTTLEMGRKDLPEDWGVDDVLEYMQEGADREQNLENVSDGMKRDGYI